MTESQKEELLELRKQGLGYKSISAITMLPLGTVKYFFLRLENMPKPSFCPVCDIKLRQTKGHRQKKFCSEKCRYEWRKNHVGERRLKAYYTAICLECGKKFTAYGNDSRKYCCRACYLSAHSNKK